MSKNFILVVDDEEDLRDVISHQLKSLGVVIELAENGRVALEKARSRKYQAILSDISMPEMNGLELLAQLREEGLDTPFVILTGFGDKTKAVEALRLGAFDFLDKPWETEKLRSTMKRAIEHGVILRGLDQDLEKLTFSLEKNDHPFADHDVDSKAKRAQKSLLLMKMQKSQFGKKTG